MIYPDNYEKKIGIEEIRGIVRGNCLCAMGCDEVDRMAFMPDAGDVSSSLAEVREFRRVMEEEEDFPLQYFYDARPCVARLRLKGTHVEEQELFELMLSLRTIGSIKERLRPEEMEGDGEDVEYKTERPSLWILAKNVRTFR